MNSLPRAVTAQWFNNAEAYLALRQRWSSLLHSDRRSSLSAMHHLLYLALLGKDWRRAFTPPSNPRKLANGAFAGWPLFAALGRIRFGYHAEQLLAPFDGLVTPAMLEAVRHVLPMPSYADYQPDQFLPGHWPFEAYSAPARPVLAPDAEGQHG